MKRALLAVFLCACSAEPAVAPASAATVVRVIDGDSLLIESGGDQIEMRLAGVNAPEIDECLGAEAAMTLEALTSAGPLAVRLDGQDQFGRSLGDVLIDGTSVAERMVAEGMALAISGSGDSGRFALQERARRDGEGIWSASACGATGPIPSVTIIALTADPPGPDEDDLDAETVTIANTGTAAVDLSGWTIRDESTANRFRLPPGTELEPGARLTVSSGCNGPDLSWCSTGPIWNNGGDTALLVEPGGRIVSVFRHQP